MRNRLPLPWRRSCHKTLPRHAPRLGDGFATCYEPRRARTPINWYGALGLLLIVVTFCAAVQYGIPLLMVVVDALVEVRR